MSAFLIFIMTETEEWYIISSYEKYPYELRLLHVLRVTFFIRVTSYCLLNKLQVTFIWRVTGYCLSHELRVTFCIRVASYCLLHELRVNFQLWVIIKIKTINLSMMMLLWQRITLSDNFLIKKFWFAKPPFCVISI